MINSIKIPVFILIILLLHWLGGFRNSSSPRWEVTWPGFLIIIFGIFCTVWYFISELTFTAWVMTIFIFYIFYQLDRIFSNSKTKVIRYLIHIFLALVAGFLISALAQLESNFSEEEFFGFVQGIILSIIWIIPLAISSFIPPSKSKFRTINVRINPLWLIIFGGLSLVIFMCFFVSKYQDSFFPSTAPSFPGITSEKPYFCDHIDLETSRYQGEEVFYKILERINSNPLKQTPEYGVLASGYKDASFADEFKEHILEDARSGLFTDPSNSIKYSQYQAALRAYYYANVRKYYPYLFTKEETEEIEKWFYAINHRAQTIEWVDWLYALAFQKLPQGPYENQEIGAGLLSLLEYHKLADPVLSPKNNQYLLEDPRGWLQRFRNTDDAIFYQPEWLDNALFQSTFYEEINAENLANSHTWLLNQALPDGFPLKYNQPSPADFAGSAYQGAVLEKDPKLLWLAGRSVDYLINHNLPMSARPGIEIKTILEGVAPETGTCLLFGDSGLPNQIGPLAPDKIAFRGSWDKNSPYLLLNLRFSGWHRYKATNAVILLYQNLPIVVEEVDGNIFKWLPEGRSLFRDKRIPRENLNGFVVARSGMSSVVSSLTNIGGPWAQDPPYYANIEDISFNENNDSSVTWIKDWRGWNHRREIQFFHDGIIVVIDQAYGDSSLPAAIQWHLPPDSFPEQNRIIFNPSDSPGELILQPLNGGNISSSNSDRNSSQEPFNIEYRTENTVKLGLVSIFLTSDWVGAKTLIQEIDGGKELIISTDKRQIQIMIPDLSEVIR